MLQGHWREAYRAAEDRRIVERLENLASEYPRYGYRRMAAQLKREGFVVNHKRVLRLMREHGLIVLPKRKYIATTDSAHGLVVYPNLYSGKAFTGINQAWVADITYVSCRFA